MPMMAPSARNSFADCAFTSSSMPAAPEQLDGSQMEVRGARQRRSSPQAFDHERRHSVLSEEHRGRETDEPSPRDDNRLVGARHAPKNRAITPATSAGRS